MDRFGDVLYSLYGSTEVAYVSVAGPKDLREAPNTAGRVLRGVTVRLVDDDDEDVAAGRGRPDLRRQRDVVRGLHEWRGQDHGSATSRRSAMSGGSATTAGCTSKAATTT